MADPDDNALHVYRGVGDGTGGGAYRGSRSAISRTRSIALFRASCKISLPASLDRLAATRTICAFTSASCSMV